MLSQASVFIKARLNTEPFDLKTNSYSDANKTRFHKNGFALSFVLKVRVFAELIVAPYDVVRAQFAPSFFQSIHWKESRELTKMDERVRECAPKVLLFSVINRMFYWFSWCSFICVIFCSTCCILCPSQLRLIKSCYIRTSF